MSIEWPLLVVPLFLAFLAFFGAHDEWLFQSRHSAFLVCHFQAFLGIFRLVQAEKKQNDKLLMHSRFAQRLIYAHASLGREYEL